MSGHGPDVEGMARSMLLLRGAHDEVRRPDESTGDIDDAHSWAKAPDFSNDPRRAAAIHEATRRDRERYLTAGLAEVDCRFCHAAVQVKKLGPPYTAVQWSSESSRKCAYFNEIRAEGGSSARARSCPRLSDSIRHAVAEGCLEEYSSAPAPGDG